MTIKYLFLPVFTLIVITATAQKIKPANTSDFITECMKNNGELPNKQMVIWFPSDFWEIVGDQMKASPGYVQQIVSEMQNYMMFAVVDYNVSPSGVNFKSEEEIRKSIKLYDSSKNVYKPLENKDISPTAVQLLNSLQPVMAQILGQFGEGMRVFLFDAKKINGKPAIDIAKTNSFTLSWAQTSLKWTLPFASVLPPKFCPVDNEQMKGNWKYCPLHGTKLDK
jgi:hypothetical protein